MTEAMIQSLSNHELLRSTEKHFELERKATYLILLHLREIANRKLYAERGYTDMYQMLIKFFRLSHSSTWQRLKALELMTELPEKTEEALKSGEVNLTTLAMAQRQILREEKLTGAKVSQELKEEIIDLIANKTEDQAGQELFKVLPAAASSPETSQKRVSATETRVSMTISDTLKEKLERLQSYWSHIDPNMDYPEIIERAVDIAMKEVDPLLRKRKRVKKKPVTQDTAGPAAQRNIGKKENTSATRNDPRKTYYTIEEDRLLYERAQNQCEFTDPLTGNRCQSKHLLQKDHIIPIAKGGTNDLENLRLLCHTHNQLKARHHFGEKFIEEKGQNIKPVPTQAKFMREKHQGLH